MIDNEEFEDIVELIKNDCIRDAEALYDRIKLSCYDDINYNDLNVSVVLADLKEIEKKNIKHSKILREMLIHPAKSLSEIGDEFSLSKQRISQILMMYSENCLWLEKMKFFKRRMFEKVSEERRLKFPESDGEKTGIFVKKADESGLGSSGRGVNGNGGWGNFEKTAISAKIEKDVTSINL